MDSYLELLKFIFPEFLMDHFNLVKNTKNGEVMHLYFEERIITPIEESKRILMAHGFHKEVTIQDFPLRGNQSISTLNTVDGWISKQNKLYRETGV